MVTDAQPVNPVSTLSVDDKSRLMAVMAAVQERRPMVEQITSMLIARGDAMLIVAHVLADLAIRQFSVSDPQRCQRLIVASHQITAANYVTPPSSNGEVSW